MKNKILVFALTLGFVGSAFGQEALVRREDMTAKSYSCSNGGVVTLIPTRYGNVHKIVFSSKGSVDQFGFTHFHSMMLSKYSGSIATSMTFGEEENFRGRTYADIDVVADGKGLVLTVTPVRMSDGPGFVCKNY